MLLDKHQLRIGKETLRRWMMAEGLWLSRMQRRTFHQPRLRRENYGELIQIDGSDHRWYEQSGVPCTLLTSCVITSNATSANSSAWHIPAGRSFLDRSELADKLVGQYVEVHDFADRPLEVRWKGHSLPYRVFSKDQCVSHTAVVENKHLGHALAVVKAQ